MSGPRIFQPLNVTAKKNSIKKLDIDLRNLKALQDRVQEELTKGKMSLPSWLNLYADVERAELELRKNRDKNKGDAEYTRYYNKQDIDFLSFPSSISFDKEGNEVRRTPNKTAIWTGKKLISHSEKLSNRGIELGDNKKRQDEPLPSTKTDLPLPEKEEKDEISEMDLVEEKPRQEEFIKKGEEKEKGKDRDLPSGEPEPQPQYKPPSKPIPKPIPKPTPTSGPRINIEPQEPQKPTTNPKLTDQEERDILDKPNVRDDALGADTQDEPDETDEPDEPDDPDTTITDTPINYGKKYTPTYKNLSELLLITARLCEDVYNYKTIVGSRNLLVLRNYPTPTLIKKQDGKIFIVVRGSVSADNWLADLSINDLSNDGKISNYPILSERINPQAKITEFHDGIMESIMRPLSTQNRGLQGISEQNKKYRPLYFMVRDQIDSLRAGVDEVVFSGHSLGGAIAGILYFLYNNDQSLISKKINNTRCITYGCPRFVRKGGQDYYNESSPNLIRCWNHSDFVTYVPFNQKLNMDNIIFKMINLIPSGFIHVGKSLCLDEPSYNYNNINQYLVDLIKDNKDILKIFSEDRPLKTSDILTTKKFQQALIGSLLLSFLSKKPSPKANTLSVAGMLLNVNEELKKKMTWEAKCDLFKNCGFEEFLKDNPMGENPFQQDFVVGSIGGLIDEGILSTYDQHTTSRYLENVKKLKSEEIETREDFLSKEPDVDKEEKLKEKIAEEIITEPSKVEVKGFFPIQEKNIIIGYTDNPSFKVIEY